MLKIEREIPIQIDPGENPFLKETYAPIATEITADDLTVIGEIPKDLDGAYLRNGPNPVFQPRGCYHWFDGDGMVHGHRIPRRQGNVSQPLRPGGIFVMSMRSAPPKLRSE